MKKVIVVIPVHKPDPTPNELASFEQCFKVLGSHPITIVAPSGLDMSAYSEKVPGCSVTFIDPHWMSDIRQYNKLKISKYFYSLFKDYEYLLTYELDAWVFRDELIYWCDKGYDYIGAPWFEKYGLACSEKHLIGGNSGFSLRKIYKSIDILKRVGIITRIRRIWFDSKLQGLFPLFNIPIFLKVFNVKSTKYFNEIIFNWSEENEDYYWSYFIQLTFTDFVVAPYNDAFKFSFETNSLFLYFENENKLPFGCHAWEKYEPEFWKKYIRIDG
ncbi:MAG: hypothetical protein KIT66_03765 [Chitinophagaceae bacterium]|nr:hypothetical protein [Chitinophagaceae bacterium]